MVRPSATCGKSRICPIVMRIAVVPGASRPYVGRSFRLFSWFWRSHTTLEKVVGEHIGPSFVVRALGSHRVEPVLLAPQCAPTLTGPKCAVSLERCATLQWT